MRRARLLTLLLGLSVPALAQSESPAQAPAESAVPSSQASPTAAPASPVEPIKPYKVASGVMASNLIHAVPPDYPQSAKINHVTGVVVVQVLIDTNGNVTEPKVISGPPLLQQAAIDAVKQWKYKPTTINGAPVEVITRINVNFALKGH